MKRCVLKLQVMAWRGTPATSEWSSSSGPLSRHKWPGIQPSRITQPLLASHNMGYRTKNGVVRPTVLTSVGRRGLGGLLRKPLRPTVGNTEGLTAPFSVRYPIKIRPHSELERLRQLLSVFDLRFSGFRVFICTRSVHLKCFTTLTTF
jgi:hypothetical protein